MYATLHLQNTIPTQSTHLQEHKSFIMLEVNKDKGKLEVNSRREGFNHGRLVAVIFTKTSLSLDQERLRNGGGRGSSCTSSVSVCVCVLRIVRCVTKCPTQRNAEAAGASPTSPPSDTSI